MFNLGDISFCEREGVDADDIGYFYSDNSATRLFHYPFCCTGAVIANLEGGANNFGYQDGTHNLKEVIEAWIRELECGDLISLQKQFLSASTTSNQKAANRVLKELGFKRTAGVSNNKYGGKLYVWVKQLDNEYDGEG